ncbi:MAG TPA: DUF4134 domain-containing protein [Puia sp.]|jgi:hypothetical protein
MLHFLSWAAFLKAALTLTLLYYGAILFLYYRKDIRALLGNRKTPLCLPPILLLIARTHAQAQTADGNNGINQANTLVRSYFDTGTQLLYAVGALAGLIGAFRVFSLWQSGHREDMNRAAAAWFGSCIFLVIVATVIKSFFGL